MRPNVQAQLLRLVFFELWVLGVFALSYETERRLEFALGSSELMLLCVAAICALHTATNGLFRIESRVGREVNALALAAFAIVAVWSAREAASFEADVTLFWALGPMTASLAAARAIDLVRPIRKSRDR